MPGNNYRSVSALGESALLARIKALAGSGGPVLLGPGDDCAVVRLPPGKLLLATADEMAEGTHFLHPLDHPKRLASKLLRINLSDLAAMGGAEPVCVLCTAAFPGATPARWAHEFVRELKDQCRLFGVRLAGGNLARARQFHLTMTALGVVKPNLLLRRDTARPGDLIFAVGPLGLARAGMELEYRRASFAGARARETLVAAFWRPNPLFAEAALLARKGLATALMDNSDGLYKSACFIAEACGCGAELDPGPDCAAPELKAYCGALGRDWREYVLGGGEDYGLVFTARPSNAGRIRRALPGARLVGRLLKSSGVRTTGVRAQPYEHF